MAEIDADLLSSPDVKAARKSQFEAQIQDLQTAREMEAAVLDSYWESKGGRPKPKQDDAPPTGGATPGASAAPNSLTPSVDPKKVRAAVEWAKANPDAPQSKEILDRVKGLTNDSL
jgi:hypothetical protein